MKMLKKLSLVGFLSLVVSTASLAASPWGHKQFDRAMEADHLTHKMHKQERKSYRDLSEGNVLGYLAHQNHADALGGERHHIYKKMNRTNRHWAERHGY